jgi:hypothetical protein
MSSSSIPGNMTVGFESISLRTVIAAKVLRRRKERFFLYGFWPTT